MRILVAAVVALLSVGLLGAAPVMTPFDPAVHGFHFANTFVNDFVPDQNLRTGGLCGGMSYAALDFYNARRPIPTQDYRPAKGTPLQGYLYSRQVHSIMANVDTWVDLLLNPADVDSAGQFRSGLDGRPGGQLAELRSFIDRRVPVPLKLKAAQGRSGDHQVLAIGYDLGAYQGDLGDHASDLAIIVCDPNHPRVAMRLAPDTEHSIWVKQDAAGAVIAGSGWRSWSVDKSYDAMVPPDIASPAYPADGLIHELNIACQTGADDLRGDSANLDLTVALTDGSSQTYPNINLGARWIPFYEETACVVLREPLAPERLREITLSTPAFGVAGDTWGLLYAEVRARGGNVDLPHIARSGFHRFAADDLRVSLPVSLRPTSPAGQVSLLKLNLQTGADELRGGSANLDITLRLRDGSQQVFANANHGQRWAAGLRTSLALPLARPLPPADVAALVLTVGADTTWTLSSLEVRAEGSDLDRRLAWFGRKQFGGETHEAVLPMP